jgi:hypothetical protein
MEAISNLLTGIRGWLFRFLQLDYYRFLELRTLVLGIEPFPQPPFLRMLVAGSLVFLSLLQAVFLLLARYNNSLSRASGIEAQFGDGKTGRKSLWPLALFHGANGFFILLLTYVSIATLQGPLVAIMCGLAISLGAIMIGCTIRLWKVLDEMVRRIWVEATALSCAIMLVIAMFASLGSSFGFVHSPTPLQAVLAYNVIYLIAYIALTAIRAPETLTNPDLDGA